MICAISYWSLFYKFSIFLLIIPHPQEIAASEIAVTIFDVCVKNDCIPNIKWGFPKLLYKELAITKQLLQYLATRHIKTKLRIIS